MEHGSGIPSALHSAWGLWAAIPLVPLGAAAVILFFGRRLGKAAAALSILGMLAASALTLAVGGAVYRGEQLYLQWPWLSFVDPVWQLSLRVDGLSWIMLFVVCSVGTLVQVYSLGYMHGDPRFTRYYAYLSLFCASMLGLVMANHFLLLFMCWELVGVSSYLLISFWFEKPAAAAAGRKAFLTTRIGDVGLLLGILFLFWTAGDLSFSALPAIREQVLHDGGTGMLTLISLLLFLGAVGKSAQMPLHVWLPDAMEGPTAVSALIHAATMVAAGVYLVARCFVLFTPESLHIVFIVGLVTHLAAGAVALTMTDIKRVLAYSTLSQLGLMVTALGLGAVSAALFHLYTHAFFKALLFLAAGSIIHAVHAQDITLLRGLGRKLPSTRAVFLIAALSMGGLPLLSGFWSKDAILLAAQESPWIFWVLAAGAVMTSTYILRLYFRCFHGELVVPKGAHPHEAPFSMQAAMWLLAAGSVFAGFAGTQWMGFSFHHLLGDTHVHEGIDVPLLIGSCFILAAGAGLAWTGGFKNKLALPRPLRPLGGAVYRFVKAKYYIDEAYARFIIAPVYALGAAGSRFDHLVVDGAVNAAGSLCALLGRCKAAFDRLVVDGAVNGAGSLVQFFARHGRKLQTGNIHQYLVVLVIAVLILCFK